jgi:transcriptional regulator with XRE-family HTH domain
MHGYSLSLLSRNKKADVRLIGVKLGRICIAKDISVSKIAYEAGVTRQTVYNWFSGVSSPTVALQSTVQKLIDRYSK